MSCQHVRVERLHADVRQKQLDLRERVVVNVGPVELLQVVVAGIDRNVVVLRSLLRHLRVDSAQLDRCRAGCRNVERQLCQPHNDVHRVCEQLLLADIEVVRPHVRGERLQLLFCHDVDIDESEILDADGRRIRLLKRVVRVIVCSISALSVVGVVALASVASAAGVVRVIRVCWRDFVLCLFLPQIVHGGDVSTHDLSSDSHMSLSALVVVL